MDDSPRAERVLDVLNLVLADVRYGLGPYTAIYLLGQHAWNEVTIALAFSFGSVAGLMSQAPIGVLVDTVRSKRALLAGSVSLVIATCFLIVFAPRFWLVVVARVIGAVAGSTMATTISAISLGIVGRARFARRAARNEIMFHAGNIVVNLIVLATAPLFGLSGVFWMLAAAGAASMAATLAIPVASIDYDAARGLSHEACTQGAQPSAWRTLLASRSLLAFAGCGALFHFANASMLGLVVQRQALADPAGSVSVAAGCMTAAQLAMVATAALVATKVDSWGRRPIFLTAFLVLALRGTLFTVSTHPAWTIAVQVLDGVGVGVFGALFPVVVADLIHGSGRFNAAQGVVGTIHSVGGILGGLAANTVVQLVSYDAAFVMQATVAAGGGILYGLTMPETRDAASTTEPAVKSRMAEGMQV